MDSLYDYIHLKFIIGSIIIIIVVVINFVKRKYQLVEINSSALIVSRLFMSETPIYFEDIKSITLKELKNEGAKIIIQIDKKCLNFFEIDIVIYDKLIKVAKKHDINFYLENINGNKDIMN